MTWIINHQLIFMLYMSGVCGILAFSTLVIRSLPSKKKSILALMEISAMLMLIFDMCSYIYRGNISETAVLIVRLSNGLVYFFQIFIPHTVTQFLNGMFRKELGLERTPLRLKLCDLLFVAGTVMIIISQFTDLYYSIDAQNFYHRAPGHFISYIFPFLIVVLQISLIIRERRRLERRFILWLSVSLILPAVVSVIQYFNYGLSLTSIATALVVIVFYVYTLIDISKKLEDSRAREIGILVEGQKKEAAMFRQTIEALANAIDAKDRYTHGHSTRVAVFSRQIAQEAGFSEEESEQIYFSALLHDIGKIGVPDSVLNKTGKLTDEEFAEIRKHPELGSQILSSIRLSPSLSIGAHYHHERYDGKGYPDGLTGEEIPAAARIIAVADAYDAMTSTRSYRSSLSPQKVKSELIAGIGTQFDPEYAKIMLRLIYGEIL